MKSCLKNNEIEIYLTHNEGKSAVALKNKIYKYMTSVSKNVYIDKLNEIGNKYNNTYHSTIKMKPADVRSSPYIDFHKQIIRKILNLKLVIMLEYQNIKTFLQKTMFQIGLNRLL